MMAKSARRCGRAGPVELIGRNVGMADGESAIWDCAPTTCPKKGCSYDLVGLPEKVEH